jgi:hypothetical protein
MKQMILYYLALTLGSIASAAIIALIVFVTFSIGDNVIIGLESMKPAPRGIQ